MNPRYWIRINRQTFGPFTAAQMRNIPELDEETFVSPEGASSEEEWTRLRDMPKLLEILQSAPEPAQAPALPKPVPAAPKSVRADSSLIVLALAALALPWAVLEGITVWRLLEAGSARLWQWHGAAMLAWPFSLTILAMVVRRRAAAAKDEESAHAASLALLLSCGIFLASGIWLVPRFKRTAADRPAAVVPATVPEPAVISASSAPLTSPEPSADRNSEAALFARSFPVRNVEHASCPRTVGAVADAIALSRPVAPSWAKVRTVEEGISCGRFWPLVEAAQAAARANGPGPIAEQMRSRPKSFEAQLMEVSASWSAARQKGEIFRVEAEVAKTGRTLAGSVDTQDTLAWEVDLQKKTLKPLTLAAWQAVDWTAAKSWSANQPPPEPGENPADFDVSSDARAYRAAPPR
jgi:hypothetical protein